MSTWLLSTPESSAWPSSFGIFLGPLLGGAFTAWLQSVNAPTGDEGAAFLAGTVCFGLIFGPIVFALAYYVFALAVWIAGSADDRHENRTFWYQALDALRACLPGGVQLQRCRLRAIGISLVCRCKPEGQANC